MQGRDRRVRPARKCFMKSDILARRGEAAGNSARFGIRDPAFGPERQRRLRGGVEIVHR